MAMVHCILVILMSLRRIKLVERNELKHPSLGRAPEIGAVLVAATASHTGPLSMGR